MLFKLLIALAIIMILASGPSVTLNKTGISDKELQSITTILDRSLVSYYKNHSGELPDDLSEDVLVVMGLENLDLNNFTYTKTSDNTFRLSVRLSNNQVILSANSDKELPIIEHDAH